MFRIGKVELDGHAVLAPMAGLTDRAFRSIARRCGAALVYTELIRARSVLEGGSKMWRLLDMGENEHPIGVQLYGGDPTILAQAAQRVADEVKPDIIDLNMGCPVPKIVSRGEGAALMRDPTLIGRLVRAVVDAVELPVTVKIRAGWDDSTINAVEVAQIIEDNGAKAVAIHARTRAMGHDGTPLWELLGDVRQRVDIPVLGNGGVFSAADAVAMRAQTGVDAVMVARGAVGNPWLFAQINEIWDGLEPSDPRYDSRRAIVDEHVRSVIDAFERAGLPSSEARACRYIRGHLIRYAAPLPGSAQFRRSLNGLNDHQSIMDALDRASRPLPNVAGEGRLLDPRS